MNGSPGPGKGGLTLGKPRTTNLAPVSTAMAPPENAVLPVNRVLATVSVPFITWMAPPQSSKLKLFPTGTPHPSNTPPVIDDSSPGPATPLPSWVKLNGR